VLVGHERQDTRDVDEGPVRRPTPLVPQDPDDGVAKRYDPSRDRQGT